MTSLASPPPSKRTSSNNSSHSTTSTPNNNYAAPHTPIASAKRPRQPGSRSANKSGANTASQSRNMSSTGVSSPASNGVQLNGISEDVDDFHVTTPVRKLKLTTPTNGPGVGVVKGVNDGEDVGRSQMSPMHPPRPVVENDRMEKTNGSNSHSNCSDADLESTNGANGEHVKEGDENTDSSNGGSTLFGIFSPVLNFLQHSKDEEDGDGTLKREEAKQDISKPGVDGDGDITMPDADSDVQQPSTHDNLYPSNPSSSPVNDDDKAAVVPSTPSIDDSTEEDSQHHIPSDQDCAVLEDEDQNYEDVQDDDDEEDEDEFNPYLFIKTLPDYPAVVPFPQNKLCLPPRDPSSNSKPISLVLDLDETLVHCTVEPIDDADMVFPVMFNGVQYKVHVRTRPYLMEFLESVSQKFEVIVFTASQQVYADELLNRIDPERKFIKHRLFREACLLVEGNYLKDLNVLNRDLSSSVLVDNSPHAFGYQVDNGIPIESWFDDPNDTELLKLDQFMDTLHGVEDVRTVVRSTFQTYKLIQDA